MENEILELTDKLIAQIIREKKWGDEISLRELKEMGAKWNVKNNSIVFDFEKL